MKKQGLKFAIALALTMTFAAAGACFAHPWVLNANIPFAFEIGDTRLPAGQYEIETAVTGSGTLLTIRQVKGASVIYFQTLPIETRVRDSQAELVFHRFGNKYFLSQVRNGDGHGRQLVESRQEKEAARSCTAIELAIAVW